MSLRAAHTNRLPSLGPCHLDLDPPQSMCSYRSAERLAPPPLFSATNHALTLTEGQVSHSNSMELISCRGLDLSASRTTPLHLRDKDSLSSRLASTSKQADECQASPSSMANAGENNTRKKLSFVQSPVLKAQYRKMFEEDGSRYSTSCCPMYTRTLNRHLYTSASPSLRLVKELDLETGDWEWEDVSSSGKA